MLSAKSMVTMYHKQKANEIAYISVQNGGQQSFLHDDETDS